MDFQNGSFKNVNWITRRSIHISVWSSLITVIIHLILLPEY